MTETHWPGTKLSRVGLDDVVKSGIDGSYIFQKCLLEFQNGVRKWGSSRALGGEVATDERPQKGNPRHIESSFIGGFGFVLVPKERHKQASVSQNRVVARMGGVCQQNRSLSASTVVGDRMAVGHSVFSRMISAARCCASGDEGHALRRYALRRHVM